MFYFMWDSHTLFFSIHTTLDQSLITWCLIFQPSNFIPSSHQCSNTYKYAMVIVHEPRMIEKLTETITISNNTSAINTTPKTSNSHHHLISHDPLQDMTLQNN